MERIGLLFSGQGTQYPGMMKDFFDNESVAKELFDLIDDVLGRKISDLCFYGTQEELDLTHNTQPCMLAGDLVAGLILRAHGIEADAVAGFSLGEYAALVYAGILSVDDAFRIIQIRADAMQRAVPPGKGAMAAFIGASAEQVEEICRKVDSEYVVAANYNSPIQTVISGTVAGVNRACEIAELVGIDFVPLAVSAPFHCSLMEPAAICLEKELRKASFNNSKIPIYMNVDGLPITEGTAVSELLIKQATHPVRWAQTLENMYADGVTTFIECGAGKTLSGLVKKTLGNVRILRVENIKTLQKTLRELQN